MGTEYNSLNILPMIPLTMKGAEMAREIRGRFSKGKIEPLEKLDLKEGDEVIITIREEKPASGAFERAAGGWKGTLDFDAYLKDLYASRRRQSPEAPL